MDGPTPAMTSSGRVPNAATMAWTVLPAIWLSVPFPAGMNHADHAPHRIEQQDRHAIGEAQRQGDSTRLCDQRVGCWAAIVPAIS